MLAEPTLDGITGLRLEALTHGDLPFGGPGRNEDNGTFAIAELLVEARQPGSDTWENLTLVGATADFSEPESTLLKKQQGLKGEEGLRIGPVSFLIDDDGKTGWRADRGTLRRHTDSVAVVKFSAPVTRPKGTQLKVWLWYRNGMLGGVGAQTGRIRLALTDSPAPRAAPFDHAATLAMEQPAKDRSDTAQAAVFRGWLQSVPDLSETFSQITRWEKQYPTALTTVLTMLDREDGDRHETFVLNRGVWDKPLHKVTPHVPAALHPLSTDEPDRLVMAKWLVDRRSPLAARVHVNRVWQAIFGAGLVETPEDFGTRAPQPEHLKLLDWLAVEFMHCGWRTKRLIRTIVSSATYQQSSRVTPQLLEVDPRNRLLARGPRFRVEAEVVRDIALCSSGLLDRKLGGPSIFPPVPPSVLKYNFGQPESWIPAQGPQRYRRAIYVFRKRTMPDPMLSSFDAPSAEFSCARRMRSNTPLASLASLNEPIAVEAARAMALRVLHEGGRNDRQRAEYAFRLCTGRHATADEIAVIVPLVARHRQRLADALVVGLRRIQRHCHRRRAVVWPKAQVDPEHVPAGSGLR